jgi:hypothetical protein
MISAKIHSVVIEPWLTIRRQMVLTVSDNDKPISNSQLNSAQLLITNYQMVLYSSTVSRQQKSYR